MQTVFIIFAAIFGCIIGSFLNVCILRIPEKKSIVTERSHCMTCGKQLKWYDMIPVLSWLILRGKCRNCKAAISPQYPIVEALNGICYAICAIIYGATIDTVLYAAMISALIVLSFIDFRTYEIPAGINVSIFITGCVRLVTDYTNWSLYLIGMISVSSLLLLLYIVTKGKGMGGGDIKLMAAAGLVLGWKLTVMAFLFGCLYATIIHLLRMCISKKDHVLAFGPYLSMGIVTALWTGREIFQWYVNTFINK